MFGLSPTKSGSSAIQAVDTVKVDIEVLLESNNKADNNNDGSMKMGTKNQASVIDLVGAIDQGTSSTRFVLFTKEGRIGAYSQMEHTQLFPSSGTVGGNGGDNNDVPNNQQKLGWHEHDPMEIWRNVVTCIAAVVTSLDGELSSRRLSYTIKAIGITNQRETTVAWNATTGRPYYNAIVWDDTRTASIATHIANGNVDRLRPQTGLPLASYFAGTKVKWLLDHVNELQVDMMSHPEVVRFGTIDTWILYQLTGMPSPDDVKGNVGGLFLTDVSNASRWLFLDLETAQWDQKLVDVVCGPHNVPMSALPEVRASSEVYATLKKDSTGIDKLEGVPVSAILGDQQAALFGQVAFEAGEAKNTYGTGMFLMMNTGTKLVPSHHGLLSTIAYKVNDEVVYALEGSVSHSGSTIQWLRDQLQIITTASDSETYATATNDGLYFVPAFSGLFAPYWRSDARGCIVGITAAHHRGHILRAALEAAAYQARELFDAIYADSKVLLTALKVDGGGTHNTLLMQFQANMIRAPVVVPKVQETTSMGAAFAAGLAVGVWKDMEQLKTMWTADKTYVPTMPEEERQKNWMGWKKAVTKSLEWIDNDDDDHFLDAQTFDHDDDDDAMFSKVDASMPSSSRTGSFVRLMAVGAVGIVAGFVLGRRKH